MIIREVQIMRELMVRDAIREALDEEMARDNTVFQMGEDSASSAATSSAPWVCGTSMVICV